MLVTPSPQALDFHPQFRLHSHMIALRQRWIGILGPTLFDQGFAGVIQRTAPMRSSMCANKSKVTVPWSRWEGQRIPKWNYVKPINVEPSDQMIRGSTGEKPNCKWKLTKVATCFTPPISVFQPAKSLALRFQPASMIVFARCACSCKL
jgi:hypothetical protein